MKPLISATDVTFSYRDRIVFSGVSFEAAGGEFIALMGCNGAGKSTLLGLIAGHLRPDSGSVSVNGRLLPQWTCKELAHLISHLPQTIRTDLPFSAEQLVLTGRYPRSGAWLDSRSDKVSVMKAMQRTSCWEQRSRHLLTLSGGQRQRVLLAACLVQETKICLFDEPSLFLDIDQQLRCFDLLGQLTQRGKLCIVVTHDLNLALSHCSRVLILSEAALVVDSSTAELGRSSSWLRYFSDRLQLIVTPEGTPRVLYK